MKKKTLTIEIPEGYDDAELVGNKIVFKKEQMTPWIKESHIIYGYFVDNAAEIKRWDAGNNQELNSRNIFAKRRQAQSMLAMAQLSQIIANDERFGGPITEEEWRLGGAVEKHVIRRYIINGTNDLCKDLQFRYFSFLAFHTAEQRDLFLEENKDLIKQYFMIDNE